VTQALQEAVEERGLYYPRPVVARLLPDRGNVAENAGGPHAAKYGVTGRWVMGLEAVLADGRVTVTGGKTRKDVAGYDLTSLLVGSEGTLAVVTVAWLRLIAKPAAVATLLAPFASLEEAANGVFEIHRRGSSRRPARSSTARASRSLRGRGGRRAVSRGRGAAPPRLRRRLRGGGRARRHPRRGDPPRRRRPRCRPRERRAQAPHALGRSARHCGGDPRRRRLHRARPRGSALGARGARRAVRRTASAAGLYPFCYGHAADGISTSGFSARDTATPPPTPSTPS